MPNLLPFESAPEPIAVERRSRPPRAKRAKRDSHTRLKAISPVDQLTAIAANQLNEALYAHPLRTGVLADSHSTWVLNDSNAKPRAVAQLSNRTAPRNMARGVEGAEAVRNALRSDEAAAVLAPIAHGEIDGLSFAIWPYCESIAEHHVEWLARRVLAEPLLQWLQEVAVQTRQLVTAESELQTLDRALCHMATDKRLSARARLAATHALRCLDRPGFRALHIASHGDLHIGNVLIDTSGVTGRGDVAWTKRFALIDWGGGTLQGWPLFDLLRAADSLRISDGALCSELRAHCELLQLTLDDAGAHLTFALAMIGANLEQFPLEAYNFMVERVLARFESANDKMIQRSA